MKKFSIIIICSITVAILTTIILKNLGLESIATAGIAGGVAGGISGALSSILFNGKKID